MGLVMRIHLPQSFVLNPCKLLFPIAAKEKLLIHLMDAQNAYLNSDVDTEIYMEAPEGVENAEGKVCLLWKSLYGLKQSANL